VKKNAGVTTNSKLIHGAMFISRQLGLGHLMSGPAQYMWTPEYGTNTTPIFLVQ